jgi:hypothetical protein
MGLFGVVICRLMLLTIHFVSDCLLSADCSSQQGCFPESRCGLFFANIARQKGVHLSLKSVHGQLYY